MAALFRLFFCLWTDTIEKLKEFFEFLNAFNPLIQLIMDYSLYFCFKLEILLTIWDSFS